MVGGGEGGGEGLGLYLVVWGGRQVRLEVRWRLWLSLGVRRLLLDADTVNWGQDGLYNLPLFSERAMVCISCDKAATADSPVLAMSIIAWPDFTVSVTILAIAEAHPALKAWTLM